MKIVNGILTDEQIEDLLFDEVFLDKSVSYARKLLTACNKSKDTVSASNGQLSELKQRIKDYINSYD